MPSHQMQFHNNQGYENVPTGSDRTASTVSLSSDGNNILLQEEEDKCRVNAPPRILGRLGGKNLRKSKDYRSACDGSNVSWRAALLNNDLSAWPASTSNAAGKHRKLIKRSPAPPQRKTSLTVKRKKDRPVENITLSPVIPCISVPCKDTTLSTETLGSDGTWMTRSVVRPLFEVVTEITIEVGRAQRCVRAMAGRRRLSRTIPRLRAVSVLKAKLEIMQCKQNGIPQVNNRSMRELVGDYGAALFNPLNEEALASSLSNEVMNLDVNSGPLTTGESDESCDDIYCFNHEVIPVQLEPEQESTLRHAPRILSESMLQELVDDAIPGNLRIYKWKRIFAINRDGDAFITMIEKCQTYKHTLMVVKTTHGNILGGFASEPWRNQDGFDKRHSYFGTGVCFLFSDYPKNTSPNKQLTTYRWTGVNDYCQICDVDRRKIAMGGGEGDFGLVLEDDFLRGSSGHCATFGNPPLIPGIDGTFDILGFEVYGMLPLLPTVTKFTGNKYSTYSLLRKD